MADTSRPAAADDVKRVRQAQVIDLDGVPVHTVSLQGLLLTKRTQRPQDIQDSLVLQRAIEAQR
jgi:hypothetical protein